MSPHNPGAHPLWWSLSICTALESADTERDTCEATAACWGPAWVSELCTAPGMEILQPVRNICSSFGLTSQRRVFFPCISSKCPCCCCVHCLEKSSGIILSASTQEKKAAKSPGSFRAEQAHLSQPLCSSPTHCNPMTIPMALC